MENSTIETPPPAGHEITAGATITAAAPARWIRPPRAGETCPFTGLRHASFYRAFAACPRVRQARMGEGKKRGSRLFWLPDIFREIERRATETATAAQG